jgi:hypothetical protein
VNDTSPDALRRLADVWDAASRAWFQEHRYDRDRTVEYACGFEDGWGAAAALLRQYANGGQT